MLSIIGTLFFYVFVIIICYIALDYYEKHRKQRVWVYVTYFFLFFISAIRYDIGNDYSGYAELVNSLSSLFQSKASLIETIVEYFWTDVAIVFFSWLCSWMVHPFVGVYIIFSLINTYLLYKVCEDYDCHKIGVLIFILSGYLFITWDGARQGSAIMVFLYSLKFIEQKKPVKYLLCIAVAFLFHKSALFLLPCYLFGSFGLKNWMYATFVFIILIIYWTGFIDNLQTGALDLLTYGGDYYSKYADSSLATSEGITSVNYKLRNTFIMGLWTLVLCWLPREKMYIKNLVFFGISFALIGNGGLTFLRISWYFLISLVVAIPIAYRAIRKFNNKRIVLNIGLLLVYLLLCRDIYIVQDRGCTPYDTIFSTNFNRGYFRPDR